MNDDDEIDEEFGITNRELRELQEALDGADYTKPSGPDSIIAKLSRKSLEYIRNKNNVKS